MLKHTVWRDRQKVRKKRKKKLVWKALGREITALQACVCLSDLGIVCGIADLSTAQ